MIIVIILESGTSPLDPFLFIIFSRINNARSIVHNQYIPQESTSNHTQRERGTALEIILQLSSPQMSQVYHS